jgi:myo-inositol-1(or 4)-monophosphatase
LFAAARGAGATLNGAPLSVAATPVLDRALLATGFPYDIRTAGRPGNNLDYFAHLHLRAQGIRRGGSAALDLAYVAAGRLDAYWELRLRPYDIGAGVLCVEEAGGRVSDLAGRPGDYSGGSLVASNGALHDELCAALYDAFPPDRAILDPV